jgi:hypothetical protein
MKTKLTALLLAAVTVLAFAPKQAQAGDKEIALIGGFIGGLVVGSALNSGSAHAGYDTTVVVHDYNRYDRGPRGHWEWTSVRVWVPGYWETHYDYGRRVQVFVPAHYQTRRERVWVAHGGGRGYDRHHRYDRYERYDRGPRHW